MDISKKIVTLQPCITPYMHFGAVKVWAKFIGIASYNALFLDI